MSPSRVNNEAVQTQAPEEESEADTQTDTDAESAVSAGSSSVNAMAWQDDPEFQAKVRWVENLVTNCNNYNVCVQEKMKENFW